MHDADFKRSVNIVCFVFSGVGRKGRPLHLELYTVSLFRCFELLLRSFPILWPTGFLVLSPSSLLTSGSIKNLLRERFVVVLDRSLWRSGGRCSIRSNIGMSPLSEHRKKNSTGFYRGHTNSSPEDPSCRSNICSSWVHALFRVAAFRATTTSPTCCVRDSALLSGARRKRLCRAFSVARRRHSHVAPCMCARRIIPLHGNLSVSPAAL